jgi:hypothetical protein
VRVIFSSFAAATVANRQSVRDLISKRAPIGRSDKHLNRAETNEPPASSTSLTIADGSNISRMLYFNLNVGRTLKRKIRLDRVAIFGHGVDPHADHQHANPKRDPHQRPHDRRNARQCLHIDCIRQHPCTC